MKKLIAIILIISTALCFASCAAKGGKEAATETGAAAEGVTEATGTPSDLDLPAAEADAAAIKYVEEKLILGGLNDEIKTEKKLAKKSDGKEKKSHNKAIKELRQVKENLKLETVILKNDDKLLYYVVGVEFSTKSDSLGEYKGYMLYSISRNLYELSFIEGRNYDFNSSEKYTEKDVNEKADELFNDIISESEEK